MPIILDGKSLAEKIENKLRETILPLPIKPKLAVVLVGNNEASKVYVKYKQLAANRVGIQAITIELPENTSEQNLIQQLNILNSDESINAILVQLPLPNHINTTNILHNVLPVKDVDCFSPYNMGMLFTNSAHFIEPCTPKGILRLLKEYNIQIEGKKALVIGRSLIVGKPTALLLQNENATVTVAHSKTKNLPEIAKNSDIIVSAVGKPHFIDSSFISNNQVIVDVGISRVDGKIFGDVDFDNVKNIVSFISPVPKGVGPMTIAMLLENTYELYNLQNPLR